MKYKRLLFLILIFITVIIQSCSNVIKMDQTQELKGGSPLSAIVPVTVVINNFQETRGTEIVGYGMAGHISLTHSATLDRKATDIFAQAIASELRRNGHRILETKDIDKPDIVINGIVKRYWVETVRHVFSCDLRAYAKAEITVSRASDYSKIVSKLYSGINDSDPGCGGKTKWKLVLNEALLNMVKDFTMDPDLLNGLSKVGKESMPKSKQQE